MQKLKRICVLILSALMIVGCSFASYADVRDLMIGTSSNAVSTFTLPRSSVASVTNTIDWSDALLRLSVYDKDLNIRNYIYLTAGTYGSFDESGASFKFSLDGTAYNSPKYVIDGIGVLLTKKNLPSPGDYRFSWDVSSAFGYDANDCYLWSRKLYDNAEPVTKTDDMKSYTVESSGDFAVVNYPIQLTSIDSLMPYYWIVPTTGIRNVDIRTSMSFVPSSGGGIPTAGNSTIEENFDSEISGSLSDLSSSVDSMTDEIGAVTDAIQDLQGAMEPHYSNVLTQLHHITEQLHAFYDQIYNNIHLKEFALWQDIKTAIENIDLEVNVNLDKLKTSIDNMSQAVQNKLQSVTDTITGGYNNSGMQEDNNELSGALDELDNAEQEVLDDVNGYIEGFEYPSFDGISSGIIGALSFFGGLLHSIFLGMGEFGLIITFSLTMIFVLIIVGYHRIRS